MNIQNRHGSLLRTLSAAAALITALLAGCSDSIDKVSVAGVSTSAAVTIDAKRCPGCAGRFCYEVCPQRAIDELPIDGRYYYIIDPQRCTNCGACINRCPFNAIVWKR
jgi:NAD-dependent dihydropyrimidine dehydrogenase PreA subunit